MSVQGAAPSCSLHCLGCVAPPSPSSAIRLRLVSLGGCPPSLSSSFPATRLLRRVGRLTFVTGAADSTQPSSSDATSKPASCEDKLSLSKEIRCPEQDGSKKLLKSMKVISDNHSTDEYFIVGTSRSINQRELPESDNLNGLKFAILVGLLTFQISQKAVAGSDFAGLQHITCTEDLGDISTGFTSALLLIFFSELGDKTFFIAALLAARNSGAVVFTGTFGALAVMSIISVVLGRVFHYVDGILPFRFGEADFPIDDFAAVCLLGYFGVTTLLEAASDDEPKSNEEQKEAELAISKFSGDGAGIMSAASTVVSTFVLVFVAEWGDKSFFSTIALAAASSPLGVIGGALAGHAVATLLAVAGGSLLGTFLSDKVIAYIGGALFLVFAVVTLAEIVS